MLNVLHITDWHPHKDNPFEAMWIKRHIDSLRPFCINQSIHIDIRKGRLNFKTDDPYTNHRSFILWLPFKIFRIWELVYFLLLCFSLLRYKFWQYDLINFHIAYPLCTYIHWLKKWIKKPMLINEHWSEYRNNFGLSDEHKTDRIRKIFQHQIPLITVSQSLYEDIFVFSRSANFPHFILPNIVDPPPFSEPVTQKSTFFMLSQWKYPKDPIKAIKGFHKYLQSQPRGVLYIGGYGPQLPEINEFISYMKMNEHVVMLGALDHDQASKYFLSATAFIHCSSYETFSVVCAEALCHGCPVVASNVGGIREYVDSSNGLLLDHDTFEDELSDALMTISTTWFNKSQISKDTSGKFSSATVGHTYFNIIKQVIESHGQK